VPLSLDERQRPAQAKLHAMKAKRSLLATCIVLVMAWPNPARCQLFQVTNVQFSSLVSNDGNYTVIGPAENGKISRSRLKQGKLYFSFTMVGLQPGIKHLQEAGSLEAHVVVYAGINALNTIDCGINQERWTAIGDALYGTFITNSIFTFRTLMYTQRTSYDALTLIVRDDGGNEITRANIELIP
jgi:hypothetical protein